MMQTWGVPSIYLHAKTYEYAQRLADKGKRQSEALKILGDR